MKKKEGFKRREVCNYQVVVGEGINRINFNKMIVLNDSAAYLWDEVQNKEFSTRDLADLLLKRYEVEEQTALADSEKIAQAWKDAGLVED